MVGTSVCKRWVEQGSHNYFHTAGSKCFTHNGRMEGWLHKAGTRLGSPFSISRGSSSSRLAGLQCEGRSRILLAVAWKGGRTGLARAGQRAGQRASTFSEPAQPPVGPHSRPHSRPLPLAVAAGAQAGVPPSGWSGPSQGQRQLRWR